MDMTDTPLVALRKKLENSGFPSLYAFIIAQKRFRLKSEKEKEMSR